jgi:septum formation protein
LEPILVLASASPRRAQILATLGLPFRVSVSNVHEMTLPGESGAAAAERLARAKAAAVGRHERLPVLAADTVVVCEGRMLGKPASVAEAAEMLRLLAGRTHEVITGVCLRARGEVRSGSERTAVTMTPMTEDEIGWYAASGEPLDKAGAYHVDGRGSLFIEAVQGSPSNVAGLPVRLVLRLVRESGLSLGLP